jgi:hypothetical protein
VHDSVEEDEYIETINKLGANVRCLEQAEGKFIPSGCAQPAQKLISRILRPTAISEAVDRIFMYMLPTCDRHYSMHHETTSRIHWKSKETDSKCLKGRKETSAHISPSLIILH